MYAAEILVAIAALAFLWLIISPYFSKKVLKDGILNKYSQRQKILTGKHNFSINPNMIIDNSEMGDSKTYWGAVERIESTNQYLFLLTQGSGPYIVPRKAFSDDSSFKQFIDLVTLYHQTSIGKK
ncbi:MAG: YcxB family protein [Dehalococcoidales bacterium]|nr:YcxB family protein [Dehalococcoidales bacterium]